MLRLVINPAGPRLVLMVLTGWLDRRDSSVFTGMNFKGGDVLGRDDDQRAGVSVSNKP